MSSSLFSSLVFILAFTVSSSSAADYRRIESYLSPATTHPDSLRYHPLANGEQIVSGPFQYLEGQNIGSLAILRADGSLAPLSTEYPLLGNGLSHATTLEDGSYFIAFHPSFPSDPLEPLTLPNLYHFSKSGELLDTGHIDSPIVALHSDATVSTTFSTATNAGISRYQVLGELTPQSLQSTEYVGTAEKILSLRDGSILALGNFSSFGSLQLDGNFPSLVKLAPDGEIDSTFSPSGLFDAALDPVSPTFFETQRGELFLRPYPTEEPLIVRINADGSIDASFALPQDILLGQNTKIESFSNDGYVLINPYVDEHPSGAIILQANGSRDTAITFDRDQYFYPDSLNYTTGLLDGRLLAYSQPFQQEERSLAFIGPDGVATPAHTGALSIASRSAHSWLLSGETTFTASWAYDSQSNPKFIGIARADGSTRSLFPEQNANPIFSLPNGDLLDNTFQRYAPDGSLKAPFPIEPETYLYAILPDGRFLATRQGPLDRELTLLFPNGAVDPSFAPSQFIPASPDHVSLHEDSLYILPNGSNHRIYRIKLDGQIDDSFDCDPLKGDISQIQATDHGVYLFSSRQLSNDALTINSVIKHFGARLNLEGKYDPTYAPEDTLQKAEWSRTDSQNSLETHVFSADGSSIQFGHVNTGYNAQRLGLFYIPTSGDPVRIAPEDVWEFATLSVSPAGEAIVNGTLSSPKGTLHTTARYSRQPAGGHSIAKQTAPAWPNTTQTFSATLADSAGYAFHWTKDGETLPGEASPTLQIPVASPNQSATYRLHASSPDASLELGPFTLQPLSIPSFSSQPQPTTVTQGQRKTLTASVQSNPEATYQWFLDGSPVYGATHPSYLIPPSAIPTLGTYQLKSTNSLGTAWSQSALVTSEGPWTTADTVLTITKEPADSGSGSTNLGPFAGPTATGKILAATTGNRINDIPVGPLVSLSSTGELDTTYDTQASLADAGYIQSIHLIANDQTLVRAYNSEDQIKRVYLLQSDGSLLFKVTDLEGSFSIFPHGIDGFLLYRYLPEGGSALERFLFSGEPDPAFANQTPVAAPPKTDSLGRIYTSYPPTDETAVPTLVRLLPDGQIDATFAVDTGTQATIYLDAKDRPYLATDTLVRLLENGQPDPSFQAPTYSTFDLENFVTPLPDGRLIVKNDLLSESGPVTSKLSFSAGNIIGYQNLYLNSRTTRHQLRFTNILGIPAISSQPRSTAVPEGSSAQLAIKLPGISDATYQWHKDGQAIPQATQSELPLPQADSSTAGDYYVTVTWTGGSFDSATATVTLADPIPTSTPSSLPIQATLHGQNLILSWPKPQSEVYELKTSTDLQTWFPSLETIHQDDQNQSTTIILPLDQAPAFYRLVQTSD